LRVGVVLVCVATSGCLPRRYVNEAQLPIAFAAVGASKHPFEATRIAALADGYDVWVRDTANRWIADTRDTVTLQIVAHGDWTSNRGFGGHWTASFGQMIAVDPSGGMPRPYAGIFCTSRHVD
jgi:hypothetical protein